MAIAQCSTHRTARHISNVASVVVWTRPQIITATATDYRVLFVVCCVQPPCSHATAQQRSHHASGHWARACAINEKRMLLCVFDEKRRLLDLVFVVLLECCLCVCCLLALSCYDATGFLERSCLQQNRPCASHDTCLLPPSFLGRISPGSSQRGRLPNSHWVVKPSKVGLLRAGV